MVKLAGRTRTSAWAAALTALVLLASYGAAADAARPPGPTDEGPAVDLNRATVEQLAELPGIGPELARRIVAFREDHGPFRRVEDLLKVRGIGEKSFQKLRKRVTVSEEEGRS